MLFIVRDAMMSSGFLFSSPHLDSYRAFFLPKKQFTFIDFIYDFKDKFRG